MYWLVVCPAIVTGVACRRPALLATNVKPRNGCRCVWFTTPRTRALEGGGRGGRWTGVNDLLIGDAPGRPVAAGFRAQR